MEDFDIVRWASLEPIGMNKPTGYLKFMNITVALFGKVPNKFQRFMLKLFFGFEIVDVEE